MACCKAGEFNAVVFKFLKDKWYVGVGNLMRLYKTDFVHRVVKIYLVIQTILLASDFNIIREEEFVDGLCGVGHVNCSFEVCFLKEIW